MRMCVCVCVLYMVGRNGRLLFHGNRVRDDVTRKDSMHKKTKIGRQPRETYTAGRVEISFRN